MAIPFAAKDRTTAPWQERSKFRYLIIALFTVGIALRLNHYFGNRSMWLDEVLVALNLRDRSFPELLLPLDYDVLAPYGFLFIEKAAALLLGYAEYALRLFPLLAGIFALFMFYRLGVKTIGRSAAAIGLGLFAVSNWPIYYAAEVKQYSSDAAIALLLYLLAASVLEQWNTRRLLALALTGLIAIWFSHPSVFVLAGIGLAFGFAYVARKDWPRVFQIAAVSGAWLVTFLITLVVTPVGTSNIVERVRDVFWGAYFMPMPPRPGWLMETFFTLFRHPVGFALYGLAAFLFLIGAYSLWNRNRLWLSLFVLPILAALAASALRMYPFTGRLLLFTVPAVLLVIAQGAEFLRVSMWNTQRLAWFMLLGLLLLHPVVHAMRMAVQPAPYERENTKAVLDYVQRHHMDGDRVYVYYGAEKAFRFYAPRYDLGDAPILLGKLPHSADNYLKDALDLQRGGRVWIVFSHVLDYTGMDERRFLTFFLDRMGMRLDGMEAQGASVYLYDLSADRIQNVRAQLFPGASQEHSTIDGSTVRGTRADAASE